MRPPFHRGLDRRHPDVHRTRRRHLADRRIRRLCRCGRFRQNDPRAHRRGHRRHLDGRHGPAPRVQPREGSQDGSASFPGTGASRQVHRQPGVAACRREKGVARLRQAEHPGAFAVAAYPWCHRRRTGCCPDVDQPVVGPCRCFRSRTGCCRGEGHRDVARPGAARLVPASGPSTLRPRPAGRTTAPAPAEPSAAPARQAAAPTPQRERGPAT